MRAHTTPLFKKLEILTVNCEINHQLLKRFHKVTNETAPLPNRNLYKRIDRVSSRNKNFIVPKHCHAKLNNSFLVKSITLWNQLSIELKTCERIITFSKLHKQLILTHY